MPRPAGGERAGVAVGEQPLAVADQRRAVLGHARVGVELIARRSRAARSSSAASPSPADLAASRSSAQRRLTAVGRVARAASRTASKSRSPARTPERDAVGGRDADRRRAAHRQPPDRVGDLVGARAAQPLLGGQARLVEQLERVAAPGDRGDHRPAIYPHACFRLRVLRVAPVGPHSRSRRGRGARRAVDQEDPEKKAAEGRGASEEEHPQDDTDNELLDTRSTPTRRARSAPAEPIGASRKPYAKENRRRNSTAPLVFRSAVPETNPIGKELMTLRSPRSEFVRKALLALAPAVTAAGVGAAPHPQARARKQFFRTTACSAIPTGRSEAASTPPTRSASTRSTRVVIWATVAPEPELAHASRAASTARTSATTTAEKWDRFDTLVREANERGIDLLLSPSTPTPLWAIGCSRRRTAEALRARSRRVRGLLRRGRQALLRPYKRREPGRRPLPKVDRFSVWNEPNRGRWIHADAARTRDLPRPVLRRREGPAEGPPAARAAPARRDRSAAQSLSSSSALFCIDARGRSLDGPSATKAGCTSGRRSSGSTATASRTTRTTAVARRRSRGARRTTSPCATSTEARGRARRRREARARSSATCRSTSPSSASRPKPPSTKFGVAPTGAGARAQPRGVPRLHEQVDPLVRPVPADDDTGIGAGNGRGHLPDRPALRRQHARSRLRRVPHADLRDARGGRAAVWGGVRTGRRQSGSTIQIGSTARSRP